MVLYKDECAKERGINDEGRTLFANLLTAAAIGSAAYNTARAVQIAMDEWEMAKKYWKIARNWLDYYQDSFAPIEDQELAEARNLSIEEPDYDIARGRTRVVAWLQYKGVLEKTMRCTSRYCTGLRMDMLGDLAAAQGAAVALADGLGYRNERAYVEARNDIRFEKMLNTAKRGRNMVADNVSLAKTSAGIYGSAWNQAWEGLSGAGYFLGYQANRNPTAYPTTYAVGREQYNTQARWVDQVMGNQQNTIAQIAAGSRETSRYGE